MTAVINFLITVFVIFCLIRTINVLGNKLSRREEIAAEPVTKQYSYCKSALSIAAIRCPHCTSELE